MGGIIITKDGKREIVRRDGHFQDLLSAYIGDDASQYFRDRIRDMEVLFDELEQLIEMDDREEALLLLKQDVPKVRWDA